jgi:pycsar effector protein
MCNEGPEEQEAGERDWDKILGPARLAYFTPVREYPPLGDRKASILLTANGLLVSVLIFFSEPLAALLTGRDFLQALAVVVLLTPLIALLLIGTWQAFKALVLPVPPMPSSLAFYPDIAGRSREEYVRSMKALTHRQALRDMLHYNYSFAVLSAAKFRMIERAFACLRAAFALWMVLMLRLALGG